MSTSRILLAAALDGPAVRRRRRSDGGLFAVIKLIDRDRLDPRRWTGFANDLGIIETLEAMRVGEPLAASGPFTASPAADGAGVEWRITIEAILTTKKKPKGKRAIASEERVRSDDFDAAPKAVEGEAGFDDSLPF